MNIEQFFYQSFQKERLENQTILLAVSGGVDSMVLLNLFEKCSSESSLKFGVAHVNHGLRKESNQEEVFLRDYCQIRGIPFFSTRWEEGATISTNVEARARAFRYQFFLELLNNENYDCLVTAHHADDQAETVLMRLIKGGFLQNLRGIKSERAFGGYKLIRPFLHFSKSEIKQYAKENQLMWFEDATNLQADYFRNRIRQEVVPLMKKENPQFLTQVAHLAEQINEANDLIGEVVATHFSAVFEQAEEDVWEIRLAEFRQCSKSLQYYLLYELFQKQGLLRKAKLNFVTIKQVQTLLLGDEGKKVLHLSHGFRLVKSYQTAQLRQQKVEEDSLSQSPVFLNENQWHKLSSNEAMGLFIEQESIALPEELKRWTQQDSCVISSEIPLPLCVRKRQPGDKMVIDARGHTKKIRRIFIDQKIEATLRLQSWVVTDYLDKILWLVPFRKSYLSIEKETDKIHYRLIYFKNE
ncbi:tRNA lysidine(34) synthetase TilS [Vagococcus entomophilus]|uniref:tRNA(Ile)-lysidine synthase n=1 Tax=Vagococcus entomophilus TaxID=1160095 RepID=A0A430AEX9_9ENTE|nr:tRNA lysidine(34) synthetase TilS [Vagococcus entomophilus]RSU06135.1 tRNA lysidine(34) synthetase TilS [Vagococcus entomophilus]